MNKITSECNICFPIKIFLFFFCLLFSLGLNMFLLFYNFIDRTLIFILYYIFVGVSVILIVRIIVNTIVGSILSIISIILMFSPFLFYNLNSLIADTFFNFKANLWILSILWIFA